jgi:lysozyme family protein
MVVVWRKTAYQELCLRAGLSVKHSFDAPSRRFGKQFISGDRMVAITQLKKANATRWQNVQITSNLIPTVDRIAARLVAAVAKTRYQSVATKTKVPWFIIAVIHEREASQSWKANLAQGDPWNKPSIHVPKGRGPFDSWEDAAVDALENCDPFAAEWKDWSAGGALTLLEEYNGLGYAARGRPSPYVWASTNQYTKGKYVADGHYDPNAVDHQLGCAALLIRMGTMDQSVHF